MKCSCNPDFVLGVTHIVAYGCLLQENRRDVINTTLEDYASISVWTINRDRQGRVVSVEFPEEDINTA